MSGLPADPPGLKDFRNHIDEYLDNLAGNLFAVNKTIHDHPEIADSEHQAHDIIRGFLEHQTIPVTRNAYGMATAVEAKSGTGGRCINFNAEYDALPEIGHACGHNLIATASLAAFLATSHVLRLYGISGRSQLLEIPAKEDGGGKIELLDHGAYKEADVSLMIHPSSENEWTAAGFLGTAAISTVALVDLTAGYHGVSAHAEANPWDGINALYALVAAYNNISMLRQQMRPDERIHGCILQAPRITNAIPEVTKIKYMIRSPTIKGTERLASRVQDCIRAAALATGCNNSLATLFRTRMAEHDIPLMALGEENPTSTDQLNVSYELPTLHAIIGIPTEQGANPHDRAFTAVSGTRDAFNRILVAGKAMAVVALQVLTDGQAYDRIREDLEKDELER